MACGSECCAPHPQTGQSSDPGSGTASQGPSPRQDVQVEGSRDDCCAESNAGADDGSCKNGCCGADEVAQDPTPVGIEAASRSSGGNTAYKDACCEAEVPSAAPCKDEVVDTCLAGCCAAEGPSQAKAAEVKEDCGASCCASEGERAVESSEDPDCCRGKPSPCCDVSCLERLAARECQQEKACNGE